MTPSYLLIPHASAFTVALVLAVTYNVRSAGKAACPNQLLTDNNIQLTFPLNTADWRGGLQEPFDRRVMKALDEITPHLIVPRD